MIGDFKVIIRIIIITNLSHQFTFFPCRILINFSFIVTQIKIRVWFRNKKAIAESNRVQGERKKYSYNYENNDDIAKGVSFDNPKQHQIIFQFHQIRN